ncbi:hypothetical protein N7468_008936 [Penicillium chermesinum]|uniref:Xylanolytic transcriptional activator regulatory domain-containing protein n=1 Tax=Penicillium chermesinum TaxID=63820 RepID=A0A9W9NGU7_9EURO|nr:uncharacterized protein N7468_008936 [Penicillium chermesinum]KAJ5219732.1 hypothetical protein N7468_008936 [Penicillium chermesinum]
MEDHLDPERPPSPVRQLRNSFGDPKPPRNQPPDNKLCAEPPCARCKKRGLSCTVNRSLQMLLEGDTAWKYSMEKKVQMLQDTIGQLVGHSAGDPTRQLHATDGPSTLSGSVDRTKIAFPQCPSTSSPINAGNRWDVVMDPSLGPGAAPGSYITQISPATTTSNASDLIARGIITLENAKLYFSKYQQRLDHFVYRILGDHSEVTFDSTRRASPLLIAAVCTVGALHFASTHADFDLCRAEFVSLSEKQSFAPCSSIETVRALCIGAFWLTDLSWPLVATALRVATDMQLHRSFFKAMSGDKAHYIRTRLYYHVYACDHHASIAFGRPPMTRECEVIRQARSFISCAHATEDDSRLVSQVTRWSLLTNVFDTFGVDIDRPISDIEIAQLRRFGSSLDNLRAEWSDRFIANAHVGNYPRKGVMLQYHFAKLYLCSHAFRGVPGEAHPMSTGMRIELDEIANSAVFSAIAILRSVVDDAEIQSFLDGLPAYFDIMITFAVVFLLKVSARTSHYVQLDLLKIKSLLDNVASTLNTVASILHPRHLLTSISKGVQTLVSRFDPAEMQSSIAISELASPLPETESLNTDLGFDPYFLGAYDFQNNQTMDLSFDFLENLDS